MHSYPTLDWKDEAAVSSIENEALETGVKLFMGSKVQGMFSFELCTLEGREGENGVNSNFKTSHRNFDLRITFTPV